MSDGISMTGTILQVMETWPLQLTLSVQSEVHHLALADSAEVTQGDQSVGPERLGPGLIVEVCCIETSNDSATVTEVKVLGVDPEAGKQDAAARNAPTDTPQGTGEPITSESRPMAPPKTPGSDQD